MKLQALVSLEKSTDLTTFFKKLIISAQPQTIQRKRASQESIYSICDKGLIFLIYIEVLEIFTLKTGKVSMRYKQANQRFKSNLKCLHLIIIKEMLFDTTLYHFSPTRLDNI